MKEGIMLYKPSRWAMGSQQNWEDGEILKNKESMKKKNN